MTIFQNHEIPSLVVGKVIAMITRLFVFGIYSCFFNFIFYNIKNLT